MQEKKCCYSYLGEVDFADALEIQMETVRGRQADEMEDTVYFLQHNPVYTLGKRGNKANLLISEEELSQKGAKLVRTDRGGDVTYHGPGQLMVYPIIKLSGHYSGVGKYVTLLEETVIRTLENLGISGRRDSRHMGVWVEDKKIAAVGIRIQKRVTMHGICLNVKPVGDFFKWIVPCGIKSCGVTSILECSGKDPDMEKVIETFILHFSQIFGFALIKKVRACEK